MLKFFRSDIMSFSHYDNFKLFKEKNDADICAKDYFTDWHPSDEIKQIILEYCSGSGVLFNGPLRKIAFNKWKPDKYARNYLKKDYLLNTEISRCILPDNMIVFRSLYKEELLSTAKPNKLAKGCLLKFPSFISTSLLETSARDHGNSSITQHKSYLLKIYLPKGTKGAYIAPFSDMYSEFEFLLPINTTVKILKRSFRQIINREYTCIVVKQE